MSLLVLTHCGVSSRPQLPQESPCFFFAGIAFTTISYSSTSIKISIQPLHSSGKRRAVTPVGIARVRRPRRVIFSRRLRPCPRKASAQSDTGRRELLRIIPNGNKLVCILFQLQRLSNKTCEKSLN